MRFCQEGSGGSLSASPPEISEHSISHPKYISQRAHEGKEQRSAKIDKMRKAYVTGLLVAVFHRPGLSVSWDQ